ncbi:hypothetical protein GE21DRAFT_5579 [Neurospora crassa]|uniref:HTH APSES-type domain-containing protein n=1 Tax=Neurospora crassa (strain ATCC 24698 / 74-OR23-1A / CBS 708.71 / DSM 1257 / FGSC 987) TaxID=367110 RepID=Q7S9H5_NEUCR|nr:hypothetical protein NCU06560 [Neurospora crassa OR74A]EAA33031.2 hypothetical protein NCU06560 [Neurospora crassa OR74A]KHE80532.1 hypothetical protein GE21DRAFT_5579 [Neurospora crassa]|eukprot:XP_962267.2 hypothetical protein NCU06560 [Neurospora crassa OR74A]
MAQVARHLPARRNPLMLEDVPSHTDLASRRRLGQTQLTPRMVTAVPGAEVDPSSLLAFDYAHLRAPLPKGIVSGIFKSSPPSYFLMRRSQDGYISATGMFKATFPYASQEEEEAERKYIKSIPTTSSEETAGNVWIPPEQALILAEEYQITPWIRALLDPSDIAVTATDSSAPKQIAPPPKFFGAQPPLVAPTPPTTRSTRSRPSSRRSSSPAKSTTTSKRGTTPRNTKRTVTTEASATTVTTTATATAVPSAETPATSFADSQAPTLINGEIPTSTPINTVPVTKIQTTEAELKVESIEKEPVVVLEPIEEEPKIKVRVDEDVKLDKDGEEVKHTKVELEVPLMAGEPPSKEEARKMIEEAKAMVEAAVKADAEAAAALVEASKAGAEDEKAEDEAKAETEATKEEEADSKGKRKAEKISVDEDEKAADEAEQPRQAKRVKTEAELRKDRIRKRAYLGLTATFAVGALGALLPIITPYVANVL